MASANYEGESGDITITLTGQSPLTRALSVFREDAFLRLRDLISDSDISFTNAEGVFTDYRDAPSSAGGADSRGSHLAIPPQGIEELRWLGFNMLSTANNHALDFGENGVVTSIKFLEAAKMAFAGTGRTLSEAREATYLDTPKGRVALLAAASWGPRGRGAPVYLYPYNVAASEQTPLLPGRPGVSLLRHRCIYSVDEHVFTALRTAKDQLGLHSSGPKALRSAHDAVSFGRLDYPQDTDRSVVFLDTEFELAPNFSMRSVPDPGDLADILRWVKDARRLADWVIVSFHDHGAASDPDRPSDHLQILAHDCVDAGADLIIGHGPPRDRGIEIYNGRPIIYALGNFIRQNQTARRIPHEVLNLYGLGHDSTPADFHDARSGGSKPRSPASDENWESAVAKVRFSAHELSAVELYPVDLHRGAPRSQAGRPLLAEPGDSTFTRVIERIRRSSAIFGTDIADRHDHATVELPVANAVGEQSVKGMPQPSPQNA